MNKVAKNLRLSSSEECRLNSVPEPIRNHIVSFLPLEDAARISILSRQWRHSCSSLSDLNFDQSTYQNKGDANFRDVVDRFLLNHDTSSISSFNLSTTISRFHITDLHINAWVSFAVRHNVQHLYLKIFSSSLKQNHRQLPCCIFTCISLQMLSLDNMELSLPFAINLPRLKSLKLISFKFDSANFIRNLLPKCPILENLVLRYCQTVQSFTISSPTLKMLELCCIVILEIKISAPRLQCLKCWIPFRANISSETPSSLICAEFDMYVLRTDTLAIMIMIGLTHVKTLSLSCSYIKFLHKNLGSLQWCPWRICCSLRHLRVGMCAEEGQVQVLILLLRSFPNLQSLNISFEQPSKGLSLDTYQKSKVFSTAYPLMQLKTVDIKNFALRSKYELHVVKYLLEHAQILEKMNIEYSLGIKSRKEIRLWVSETMHTYTKISPRARVVFL